ncbi:MAG: transcriptional regulator [Roseburia sp.]|nr:transcriptional regulator [Roseburia sp.]
MNMKELIKELRTDSGMNMKTFAAYFRVPYRTYQDWEYGKREMPEYLLSLMAYKLKMEGIVQSIPEELSDNE